jgi:hypothetical protein
MITRLFGASVADEEADRAPPVVIMAKWRS